MISRSLLNIGLALFLAVLVTLVIFEPGKEKPSPALKLTSLVQTDINSIVIEQPQLPTVRLQKYSSGWQMQKPLSIHANNEIINNLLAITSTTSHASYSASEVNLDQLKLSAPHLTIQLDKKRLSFGDTDALRGYRYVLTDNIVHLITDRFSHLIRGKPSALVSVSPLPSNTSLQKLILPEFTLIKKDVVWTSQPDRQVTSADQIQELIDEWRYARAIQVSLHGETNEQTDNAEKQKISTVEIQTINNEIYQFEVYTSGDEVILLRPQLGLRYHFDTDTANKLLGIQHRATETINH